VTFLWTKFVERPQALLNALNTVLGHFLALIMLNTDVMCLADCLGLDHSTAFMLIQVFKSRSNK